MAVDLLFVSPALVLSLFQPPRTLLITQSSNRGNLFNYSIIRSTGAKMYHQKQSGRRIASRINWKKVNLREKDTNGDNDDDQKPSQQCLLENSGHKCTRPEGINHW